MAKLKIKSEIKNKTENEIFNGEFLGLKIDNKITYNDNNIKTIVKIINNEIIIERKSSDYLIVLPLNQNKITEGIYDINNLGSLKIKIKTNKLIIDNNKIETEYIIIFDDSEKVEFSLKLEVEEIL